MSNFSGGARAWAVCDTCGFRGRYTEMVTEPVTRKRVHKRCMDKKVVSRPVILDAERIALQHPRPDAQFTAVAHPLTLTFISAAGAVAAFWLDISPLFAADMTVTVYVDGVQSGSPFSVTQAEMARRRVDFPVTLSGLASRTVSVAVQSGGITIGTASATGNGWVGDDTSEVGTGGDEANSIVGAGGNDSLSGMGGADTLDGDAGADLIIGGSGNDSIGGGTGADNIDGGTGDDTVDAGDDNDSVVGGEGNDTLDGGNGVDTLVAGNGDDSATGGDGDDALFGQGGNDTVSGGAGHDYVDGGEGNDSLAGGAGNDTIDAGAGNDTILGDGGAVNFVTFGTGSDRLELRDGCGGQFTLDFNAASDVIAIQTNINGSGMTSFADLLADGRVTGATDPVIELSTVNGSFTDFVQCVGNTFGQLSGSNVVFF